MFASHRHRKYRVTPLVLSLLLLATTSWAQTEPPPNTRNRLDHFLHGLATFSADFEQRVYDETGELLESAAGIVSIARPGKFSWEYQQPYRQSIVSDGKTLWLYDADLAQVTINAVESSAAGSAAQLLGEDTDIDATYDTAELGEREGAEWLKLTPKAAAQQYAAVELGLRAETLAGIRLLDNLGQITELRFSNLRRNPALAASLFTFSPPPDVDVVRGTGIETD
ncbi:MAG: outer membrane lipoprotein chaperone LolA [Gammaproteobacteria bacterium]|nr:outer membrane lipoprotein chaperone LolA [Gammaproteobacteria bacterium]